MSTKSSEDAEPNSQDNYIREDVEGGTLVYQPLTEFRDHLGETVQCGKQLAGFESVDDWDAMRAALVERGHGVGAMYHLPEIDA